MAATSTSVATYSHRAKITGGATLNNRTHELLAHDLPRATIVYQR